jgi:hypothetical protein
MKEIISDWCEFCEGRKAFDKSHFYTLFWEDITQSDLRIIFKYFPKADKLFELTYDYLFGETQRVPEALLNETLIELALNDINQKKYLLHTNSDLFRMVDSIKVEFVDDDILVQNLSKKSPYLDFFDAISDTLLDSWIVEDKKTYALYEAFYGLTKSYEIVWGLFSPLFSMNISFQYYIQFTSFGGVYCFLDNKLLVSKKE